MPKINNLPSDEQLRPWFIGDRKTTHEVAGIVGGERQTVGRWKKRSEIQVGPIPIFRERDLVYRYRILGETPTEIGRYFDVHQHVISHWMRKWGIECLPDDERNEIRFPVTLTEEQDDLVRGSLLGDAHLFRNTGAGSGKNSFWTVTHGDRQRIYIQHKHELLQPYPSCPVDRWWRVDPRCKQGGSWSSVMRTCSHRFWTGLRQVWYPEGIKIVPLSEVEKITPRSLAYLYADDGSKNGMASNIYTLSFTRFENELIAHTLDRKFGLRADVRKFSDKEQYYIHFDRKYTARFMDIIAPFLDPLEDVRGKLVPRPRAVV